MTKTLARWTVEDYHRMVEAGILNGRQVELLNGEIVEMTPEGIPHAYYSDETADYLQKLLGDQAKIREAKPITLSDTSEPEPDITIAQPLGAVYLEHHPYPENIRWLIGFSQSNLTKDLEDKTKIYAAAGIQEYWVVNLRDKQLVVFRSPVNGEYQSREILTDGVVSPFAFPDVEIQVSRLFGQ